jgi:hypothetical protein
MKKFYIDIDGVLLTSYGHQAAEGLPEFIDFVTRHFDCYWLSSYCKGDAGPVLRLLSKYVDAATLEKLKAVKATTWRRCKSEAIDLESDFVWLDDAPRYEDRQLLKEEGRLDRLIVVDLIREGELLGLIKMLKNLK